MDPRNVRGQPPPPEWFIPGARVPAPEYRAWVEGKTPAKSPCKAGKHNAKGGTCPVLGHRYRSLMERRFGLYLHFLGYRLWTDKAAAPPPGSLWYAYERREWEFPGIKGKNYHYTSDYECWPALPDPDRPGASVLPYACYEVKGWMDGDSNVKLKRMAKYFPCVPVVVVDERVFGMYTHGAESVIEGWSDG